MARAFRRKRDGTVSARLEQVERDVLARLFTDVADMLDPGPDPVGVDDDPLAELTGMPSGFGAPVERPVDPAIARLLPDGARDDDAAAAEYRRFTERGLRDRKRAGLLAAVASLDGPNPLVLTHEAAAGWLVALTDVRLVLGERLGLRTDEDAIALHDIALAGDEGDPDVDPQLAATAGLYDVLTWLQETLADALSP